jgi:mannose/fructose/N-acetylgalactosamine-specific phosphotransferase system component IID
MANVTRGDLISTFIRSFLVQGSWNYRTMLGAGFAFALLPALRRIFQDDPEGLEASLNRHVELFNAHPYMSNVALGAVLRLEAEGADEDAVRRFKTAVRGPLGGLGDSLVWASWLPAVSMFALTLFWIRVPGWLAVTSFLVIYNIGHLGLRVWGFRAGLAEGRGVARSLSRAGLGAWVERIRGLNALLLGVLVGSVLAGNGGLAEGGPVLAAFGVLGFVAGDVLGHRVWRPTAVTVVVAVVLLATWGWAS